MKLLVLTNEFEEESYGGAGTAATGMINLLDRMGVQQTVVVPRSGLKDPSWDLRGNQIKVLEIPRNDYCFGYLGLIRQDVFFHEVPELDQTWDLIHIQAINFAPLAYVSSNGTIPILYSVYSFLRQELGDSNEPELQAQFKIQEELLMRSQCIHLVSKSEMSYLAKRFPEYLFKTEVLSLGISMPSERWHPGNTIELLYVGRLLNYKGIEDLIKAVSFVRKRGRNVRLNIVGKGAESYEDNLKRLVRTAKLDNSVKFHGWKSPSEVRKWMAGASCLVVPSHREAFGLVALEGMIMGTPVIASNAGGLLEIASNNCALTFEAGNFLKLSHAIVTLHDNPYLQMALSQNGRQKALKHDWNHLGSSYMMLLERTKSVREYSVR